jgi:hypothetical protein
MFIDVQNGETNRDALFLTKKMRKRNTVLMCLIWNTVLERIQCNKEEVSEPTA